MEIIIKTQVETKHSIELPYYSKSTIAYYKIISEKECLTITTYDKAIILQGYVPAMSIDKESIMITEDEFTSQYFLTQALLNAKLI